MRESMHVTTPRGRAPVNSNVRFKAAQAMSPERQREFNELRAFIDFYCAAVKRLDADSPQHPSNVLKGIVEQFGKSKALQGLRQATNDTLQELADYPPSAIAAMDSFLRSQGMVTVSELQLRYSASYERIVHRGVIRTETEYHLLNGIVVDLTTPISQDERSKLQQLLEAYERGA